jgi:hypothetical protein
MDNEDDMINKLVISFQSSEDIEYADDSNDLTNVNKYRTSRVFTDMKERL